MVDKSDIVFYLGNFAKGNKSGIQSILDQIHGRINLIVGTEDTHNTILNFKNKLASVYYKLDIIINNIPVTMNHHPQRLWNRKEYGA